MLHHVPTAALQDRLFAEAFVFAGSDSVASVKFRMLHVRDTCNPVTPESLPDRLRAAGFGEADVEVRAGRVRWRAVKAWHAEIDILQACSRGFAAERRFRPLSVAGVTMPGMGDVFLGRQAVAAGRVTRHELQRWYRPIYRGVYVPKRHEPSLRDRTVGALLASPRRAVVSGIAASALHGAQWIDSDAPIELIAPAARPQRGLLVRNERLAEDEVTRVAGIPVTTPARTAFDIARHLERNEALARLDALMYATPFEEADVLRLAQRYPGARGLRRLREVLPLVDGGAASPKETWLRLLLIDAGFPRPVTQIPVADGWRPVRVLDMGWEIRKVAAEYDGDQHRTNRRQYVKDLRCQATLQRLGWIVVRVIAEDREDDIIGRVDDALGRRGYRRD